MDTIVSIDLETTGLDPVRDAIIEIGAVKFNGNRVEGRWETLINPRKTIPPEITQLTGISNDMVRSAPLLQDVRQDLEAFVGDSLVLGHNVQFDLGFLRQRGILEYSDWIDTYALASVLLPTAGRYNLGALAEALRIPLPATHRALDDALATHAVFIHSEIPWRVRSSSAPLSSPSVMKELKRETQTAKRPLGATSVPSM
jgi:DNA polymerase-3 subunit epsilon/ATP-dependent DNA helicase DinG